MLDIVIHYITDGYIQVVVLLDDTLRKFEGGFVTVFELPANARIVGVEVQLFLRLNAASPSFARR